MFLILFWNCDEMSWLIITYFLLMTQTMVASRCNFVSRTHQMKYHTLSSFHENESQSFSEIILYILYKFILVLCFCNNNTDKKNLKKSVTIQWKWFDVGTKLKTINKHKQTPAKIVWCAWHRSSTHSLIHSFAGSFVLARCNHQQK